MYSQVYLWLSLELWTAIWPKEGGVPVLGPPFSRAELPHFVRRVGWLVAGIIPALGGPESCWLVLCSQHSAKQGCNLVEYMSDPPRGLLPTLAFSGSRSHTSPPWCEWLPVRLWGGSNHQHGTSGEISQVDGGLRRFESLRV